MKQENVSLNFLLAVLGLAFISYVFFNFNEKISQHKETLGKEKQKTVDTENVVSASYSDLSIELPDLKEKVIGEKTDVRLEVHYFYHNKPPIQKEKSLEKMEAERNINKPKKFANNFFSETKTETKTRDNKWSTNKRINESPLKSKQEITSRDQERLNKAAILVATNKEFSITANLKEQNFSDNKKESVEKYYLKVAAYQNYNLLEEKGKKLEAYDLIPVVQTIKIEGKERHRLYIGIFEDHLAEEWLAFLRQEGWNPEKILDTKAESDGDFYSI